MPIATACFWLVTFLPPRPERSLPSPYSCITLLILRCALGPYFLPDDFLLDERFFVAMFSPLVCLFLLWNLCAFLARLRQSDGDGLFAALNLVLAGFFVTHLSAHFGAGFLAVLAAARLLLCWHQCSPHK